MFRAIGALDDTIIYQLSCAYEGNLPWRMVGSLRTGWLDTDYLVLRLISSTVSRSGSTGYVICWMRLNCNLCVIFIIGWVMWSSGLDPEDVCISGLGSCLTYSIRSCRDGCLKLGVTLCDCSSSFSKSVILPMSLASRIPDVQG